MPTLKLAGLEKRVAIQSIIWIEGDGNYARFYFDNSQEYLVSQTLKCVEAYLPAFIRIHKSVLINPDHITQFEQYKAKEAFVVMSNGHRIQLAYRRIDDVRTRLGMVAFQTQSFQVRSEVY
ncbi:LytTR family transcriptional regulator [Spirosoma sp. RP8]|uniref:LytTR family transcriptional regulator n=1 Tax=Spirosoma liriopis TaxID=2937440 RepID=A0ABT0HMZ6_9BACT|nr:LytTR family DNA-binding domain-containing protein [Spirosoma liriopis]MCK8493545.1 LytTR family transcriptional regulator [Spirosoma liriopis]